MKQKQEGRDFPILWLNVISGQVSLPFNHLTQHQWGAITAVQKQGEAVWIGAWRMPKGGTRTFGRRDQGSFDGGGTA